MKRHLRLVEPLSERDRKDGSRLEPFQQGCEYPSRSESDPIVEVADGIFMQMNEAEARLNIAWARLRRNLRDG